ncbi:MAG: hypothetical protein HRF49_12135 [bacterium]|jgi:hypothetical protein
MNNRNAIAAVLILAAALTLFGCVKIKEEERSLFVTPKPEFSPKQVEKRIFESSKAPVLAAAHLAEDVNLCWTCHPKGALLTEDPNLIFSHQKHFAQGIVCHTCHRNDGALVYTPVKEDCIACHADRNIPVSCKTCHKDVQILKPESHKVEGFINMHGKTGGDLKSCSECHGQTRFCIDCHGLQMPHPDDYLRIHPSQVLGDPARCTMCHGQQPCMSCHAQRSIRFE